MNISCKKSESTNSDSNGAKLRLTKIADNQAMENSFIFTYNADGLVTKISEPNQYWDISYNSSKQPIEVKQDGHVSFTLIWESNKCTSSYPDFTFTDVYVFDSKSQIKKAYTVEFNSSTNKNDTSYIHNYVWEGDTKLSVIEAYSGGEATVFNFGSIKSPLLSLNVVLVEQLGLETVGCEESQNLYATENYAGNYSLTISYTKNEQNYPIKADIVDGITHSYSYFEYEVY